MKIPTKKHISCFELKTMRLPSLQALRIAFNTHITDGIETSHDINWLTYCALTVASDEPGYPVNNLQPGAAIEKSPMENPWIYHEL